MSAGPLAAVIGDAYAQPSRRRTCVSDHDRNDLPDYGTITGLTDRDSTDTAGRGRQTGLNDSDGVDRPGRGYGPNCPAASPQANGDNDSGANADPAGHGRGRSTGVTDNDSGPNADAAGHARSSTSVSDNDSGATADAAGHGRGHSSGGQSRGYTAGPTSSPSGPSLAGENDGTPAPSGSMGLPAFPWPPPSPTVPSPPLPRGLVIGRSNPRPSLLYVARRITAALMRASYVEFTFYSVPNGFALVSRFEQILPSGEPAPGGARYPPPDGRTPLSFDQYLASLFVAPVGHYRQIVFVATNAPFVANGKPMSADVANQLLRNGANRLPDTFNRMIFGPDYAMTPLIYEYEKSGRTGPMVRMQTSPLTSQSHLSPILTALSALP